MIQNADVSVAGNRRPTTSAEIPPTATGCYGWPRTCDHFDDLACFDAEQRIKHPGWDRLCRRVERDLDLGNNHPAAVKPSRKQRGWRR